MLGICHADFFCCFQQDLSKRLLAQFHEIVMMQENSGHRLSKLEVIRPYFRLFLHWDTRTKLTKMSDDSAIFLGSSNYVLIWTLWWPSMNHSGLSAMIFN